MLSWLREKTGEREAVPPAVAPWFEPLEARLLLNADLSSIGPVPAYEATPVNQAVYVDLDGQDDAKQEDSSPILTLDVSPGDQMTQAPTEQENAAAPESGSTRYRDAPEVSVSDARVALDENAVEPVLPAQPDNASSPPETGPIAVRGPPAAIEGQQAVELFNVLPALFVENQGQWSDPSIRYAHDGEGVDVAMTDAGVLFGAADADGQMLRFSASFVGADSVQPVGLQRSEAVFNYFPGDQARWQQNVPAYEIVAYEGLYEGIDLRVQGLRSHLKYEFQVAPGADYTHIAVRYEGIEGLSIAEDGSLQVNLGAGRGVIQDDAPYIYQEIDGRKVEVAGRFILLDDRTYSFEVTGALDPGQALVIDPDLLWSTYLGGSSDDAAIDVAVDGSGNVYVTGYTNSPGWISGGFDTSYDHGYEGFVAKLSPSGVHLWSTYLGGSGDDFIGGIAVDDSGNVYVTGQTYLADWISGGFDTTYNGGAYDGFVAKLSSSGTHLWSTYLGGSGLDSGADIALDVSGNVYVSGSTNSSGWTSGGFDTTFNGGDEAFVVKLSSDGAHLWSTYLGGAGTDWGTGIVVDVANDVYISGYTTSSGWTAGGFDTTYNGGLGDGFVVKLNSGGTHLWSTYLGGNDADGVSDISVSSPAGVYVTGLTSSAGWTAGGFDTSYNGGNDGFAAKLNSSGGLLWSTYLGGGGDDGGEGIAVDDSGNAYVTGYTLSSGWASGGFDTTYHGGYDAFVAKLNLDGMPVWSTYLGGSQDDLGYGIAVHGSTDVYVAGRTFSADWPTGGFDTSPRGGSDAFVARLEGVPDTTPPSPNPSTWATEPYATSSTSIRMVATSATDTRGVEYYFHETSGNPGATDSGWQDSNTYEDTDLSPGTTYTYQVKTRDKSSAHNETDPSGSASAMTPSPVYRFWSRFTSRHFYTISEREKDKLIDRFSYTWTYEGIAYYAFPDGTQPGTVPVYRLWSDRDNVHLFTTDQAQRDGLIATNPADVWMSEGIAFYVYPTAAPLVETSAVYRFWSPQISEYFFTISTVERDYLRATYPSNIWAYDDEEAWYAFTS